MAQRQSLLAGFRMQALSSPNPSPVKRAASANFRQRCASALMHPVTLGALGVLLVNDLVFKALWPGAWAPGKLSDLAWMMFAPPVLAFVLSFATMGIPKAQRAAFIAAYAGLPLLYVAFNTFAPVHDAILLVLGLFGGDGPRSPLDPTDSIVIPVAMAAAIWVWRRPPLQAQSMRTRLALLAATAAALASVATSYVADLGVVRLGRTASGTLGANTFEGFYENIDGGLTWTKTGEDSVPLKWQEWIELEVGHPSDAVFILGGPHLIGERRELERADLRGAVFILDSPHIIGEGRELEVEEPSRIFSTGDIRITNNEVLSSGEVIYSFEYLQSGGNRWMQALDKREIGARLVATRPLDIYYDSQSGNLILAMGIQGVVVIAPDGTTTKVAVGRYSPTDFSFWSKTRTFFSSIASGETAVYTGLAVLLAFSFASLALAAPAASGCARWAIALAAAISVFLAISVGVYSHVIGDRPRDAYSCGTISLLVSGLGMIPFLMVLGGLANARINRRQLLALIAATIGMLLLIWLGALVLFETGPFIANFVAVGLVGLAAFGLWVYQERRRDL